MFENATSLIKAAIKIGSDVSENPFLSKLSEMNPQLLEKLRENRDSTYHSVCRLTEQLELIIGWMSERNQRRQCAEPMQENQMSEMIMKSVKNEEDFDNFSSEDTTGKGNLEMPEECEEESGNNKTSKSKKDYYNLYKITASEKLKCKTCMKSFSSTWAVRAHQSMHLAGDDPRRKQFECQTCHKSYTEKGDLKKHERIHNDDIVKTKPYKCDVCQVRFRLQGHLKNHSRTHLPPEELDILKVECDICHKICSNNANLEWHKRSHHEYENVRKPFKCDKCGKRFAHHSNLAVHKNTHFAKDDPKKKTFKCDMCEKVLETAGGLHHHKRTHLGEFSYPNDPEQIKIIRPFKCESCERRFKSPKALKSHRDRIHGSDVEHGPFDCDSCDRSFPSKSGLSLHKTRLAPAPRPFQCDICNKCFTSKYTLINHTKIFHESGERKFECEICDRVFMHKHNLGSHITRMHKATDNHRKIKSNDEQSESSSYEESSENEENTEDENLFKDDK